MASKFNIKKASEALNHGIKALIYGNSGVGKTSIAGTLPGKTLLINAENGTLVLRNSDNADNIDVLDVSSIQEIGEIYQALVSGELKYDNVVLDSLSEIGEWLFNDLEATLTSAEKEFGGKFTIFKTRLMNIVKMFRDLSGTNVVMLSLADTVDINGVVKLMPSLPHKKTQTAIVALFDEVLYLETSHESIRHLRTTESNMHVAKSRMNIEDNTTTINLAELYPDLVISK